MLQIKKKIYLYSTDQKFGQINTKYVLWNNQKYALYSSFHLVATFCSDYGFARTLHSVDELQEIVTWNGFHFPGVPCQV